MEQTFLSYALTDPRFAGASGAAIARHYGVPFALLTGGAALSGIGPAAVMAVLFAAVLTLLGEWILLVVRMARRIALGEEDPALLVEARLSALTRHLVRTYY